jgi:mRNA interferase MazF
MKLKRGSIWLVDFDPSKGREQGGRRPAVILSSNDAPVDVIGLVYVLPGTTAARGVPNHLPVEPSQSNGLDHLTFFMGEQLRAVSIDRLVRHIGQLDETKMVQIEEIIVLMLDLGVK